MSLKEAQGFLDCNHELMTFWILESLEVRLHRDIQNFRMLMLMNDALNFNVCLKV